MKDLLVPEANWRHLLGLDDPKKAYRNRATRINIRYLNAVPTLGGGLHRWLHREDVLRILYSEAERTNNRDLRVLADRIKETTMKETP